MKRYCLLVLVAFFVLFARAGHADVRLPAVFSDHMVLQRDASVSVWGWADPDESIRVSIADQSVNAQANGDGRWQVELAAMEAGGPFALVVKGNNEVAIEDVLIGEVWLCSGQSNMAMQVQGAMNFDAERAAADLPKIRMFTTARQTAPEPQDDCTGTWAVCSPDAVGAFSATAYFFGRRLHESLDVPVGLINSSWGGTAVEAWTSWSAQKDLTELEPIHQPWLDKIEAYDEAAAQALYERRLEKWQQTAKSARDEGKDPPRRPKAPVDPRVDQNRPANLFNGMIHPLIPYSIRGAIWYQGERNSHGETSKLYGLQLAAMIDDWRSRWGHEFAFEWVQLPGYMEEQTAAVETGGWVIVQEQMLKTLAVANTGMAITIDVGDAGNIHPKNKQAVGDRLARWALAKTYEQDICPSGPLYRSAKRQDNAMAISFDFADHGLKAEGDVLRGFAIAGEDQNFVWADAQIDGDRVIVSSPDVADPAAVRYSWASNPLGNLFNGCDLPASPFRTDQWPLDTQDAR